MSEAATEAQAAAPEAPAEESVATRKDWQAEAEKWKNLARKHESTAKSNADKAAQFDQMTEAQKTELEKAQGELTRWQTEAETWRGAAVASTVRALAAPEFADPDDAVRNVDPAKYLDAGGVIDEAAIKADLDALLEAKPHYRRADGAPAAPRGVPAPNRAQGASNGSPSSSDPAQQFASILQGHLK